MLRLTKDVIDKILNLNEGFTKSTNYNSRNFKESRDYIIKGGKLLFRSVSKTSWADSRSDNIFVADIDQTRRFLNKYLHLLNLGDLLKK